ncbi:MAG: sel1 repeat family protein [Hymenobacter sp.]|jgi:TPR repeat protein|nr:sel1 repeat family protein [Hymenobacter sp.]
MKYLFLCLICVYFTSPAKSQTGAQLSEQAKKLLAKGEVKTALPTLKRAAELGNAEAQYNYGICFQQGIGAAKNDATAHEWFLKSAGQGYKDAQYKVAFNYSAGRGVPQDYQKGFQWSLKCAEQEDTDCMFNVVSCYMQGAGTAKNIDSLLVWAVRLAKLPNPENLRVSGNITNARENLAMLYRDGTVLPKDLTKSYAWLLAYNENKRDSSVLLQAEHIKDVQTLEKQLTKLQQQRAKADIEQILGRPLSNFNNRFEEEL